MSIDASLLFLRLHLRLACAVLQPNVRRPLQTPHTPVNSVLLQQQCSQADSALQHSTQATRLQKRWLACKK